MGVGSAYFSDQDGAATESDQVTAIWRSQRNFIPRIWYYYERKLKKGEKTDIFRSFTIPSEWDTKYDSGRNIIKYYTENSLDIVVTVEAVGDGDWTKEKATVRSPKTGDDTALFLTAVLCLGSAAAAYAVWKWRKQ